MTALVLLCLVLFVAGPLKILPFAIVAILAIGLVVFTLGRVNDRLERRAAYRATQRVLGHPDVLGNLTAEDAIPPRDGDRAGAGTGSYRQLAA
jgi:hypothetical protein